ncbi:hypothetical protein GW17_00058100, partial [Ensete ventricosum]
MTGFEHPNRCDVRKKKQRKPSSRERWGLITHLGSGVGLRTASSRSRPSEIGPIILPLILL